jgi:hypothetical protein
MARKRKVRTTKKSSTRRISVRDIAAVWKALIVFNMIISVAGFWMVYSQNNYIMDAIERSFPVALPADYKGTSVVISPLTGQFIAVSSITAIGTLLGVLALAGMYFLLKENL